MGRLFQLFGGRGWRFPGIGPLPTFWSLKVYLGSVMAPLTVSFSLLMCYNEPEKAMAPHSSTLAWKIPWTEEPGGLQSVGSQRVGHN